MASYLGFTQSLLLYFDCRVRWFRLLLYPRWKPRDKDDLQGFAVARPEPLVHFALSSGSHSDPVMRLYSPRRLLQQLEAAKEEFIRGNVGVRGSGRSRVILPKVLESYARDAGLAAQELLRVVESCLPEGLRAAVRQQGRPRGGRTTWPSGSHGDAWFSSFGLLDYHAIQINASCDFLELDALSLSGEINQGHYPDV
ncbi:hypothetical protein D1007_56487 [Hordeum vulgare]|nr:hypothetical protein D1007_56487 [Hordeum vulgare]